MKKLIISGLILGVGLGLCFAQDAQTLLQKNGCMACHNIVGPKSAPAFAGIARRNLRWYDLKTAKTNISNAIINGSKGKYPRFTNIAMPSFPNIDKNDLKNITDYIISLQNRYYNGQRRGAMRGLAR